MTSLGIDVGGTNTRCALVDEELRVVDVERVPSACDDIDTSIATALSALLSRNPSLQWSGVGVGLPEFVRDGVATSALVVNWSQQSVARMESVLSEFRNAPTHIAVEADVRCGALAERAARPELRNRSMLYVSWGTGISSTLVMPDARCWEGQRGRALALGEWRSRPAAAKLEHTVSGAGLRARYAELTGDVVDAGELAARSVRGQVDAVEVVQSACSALAHAIAAMVHVLDPALVVLGGGLGTSALSQRVIADYDALGDGAAWPSLLTARLGADAGVVGAAIVGRWHAT